MSEWTETKAVLHELENLFSRDDDLRDINEIKSLEKELLSTYEANLKDTRDIIKGLTSEIATLEDQIVAPSEVIRYLSFFDLFLILSILFRKNMPKH